MQYAALIRGIMPMNPNMKGEKLKAAFESAGFTNVHTIIASGNLIFESKIKDTEKLENMAEKALGNMLGLTKNTVIVRSRDELKELVSSDPFKGKTHSRESYLLVTFFKDRTLAKGGYIKNVFDTEELRTPETMARIEKKYGTDITSRTWKTVEKIVAKFEMS